eukprot:2068083-Amphidinium_carterae.1
MVAPARGVLGSGWAKNWYGELQRCGLLRDPRPPFLRLYSKGTWLSRPPSHAEATVVMKRVFRLCGAEQSRVDVVTPHAMKATMLSWAAKFGLSADHRRVLGYHVVPADRSMN